MITKIVVGSAVWLVGLCCGFALAAWLLIEPVKVGDPKYHKSDFNRVPATERRNDYGHEPKRWEFKCVGSEKDCGGSPMPIPEPGTLALLVAGALAAAVRYGR